MINNFDTSLFKSKQNLANYISEGKPLNETDSNGLTLLHYTVKQKKPAMVKMLVDAGASVDMEETSILTYAVNQFEHRKSNKSLDKIIDILIDAGAPMDIVHEEGGAPLHSAAWCGYNYALQKMLDAGANPNIRHGEFAHNCSPLHYVLGRKTAGILLDAGADIQFKDSKGNTPLHNAPNAKVQRFLMERGADIHACNNNGETPLHRIAESMDFKRVKMLVDAGADRSAKNKTEHTPYDMLMFALDLYERRGCHNDTEDLLNPNRVKVKLDTGSEIVDLDIPEDRFNELMKCRV